MKYPVAIELGNKKQAYGVIFPDLPGCFSAGDDFDEALRNAEEAAALWIDTALDNHEKIPRPSSLEAIRQNPAFKGWSFGFVDVSPDFFSEEKERINISLPKRVLRRLDEQAKSAHLTRSGFIAQMVLS